ncbi:AsnC family protein [Stutzerimonas nosocomialis]|uniref:Siroheme decarboxylase NirL subunit n=1 Tax=Stutzerimonas nosocomialis TaxID=1056496 RepID=A0A5R9QC92_9GAMM|nr:Lrp/AsnC family transcriptional regulator [Stutzerimonas nosocomialis]TLX62711.1 AsnC family protein [Stutzerimonas nosocomialis]
MTSSLDDRQSLQLRRLLETGLPLAPRPYQLLAARIGASEQAVIEQVRCWSESGLFRRVGLVVKHRALGFQANAMLVMDIPDEQVDAVGRALAQAPGINLCYQRPRRLPQWTYNLFCMVHGRERRQVCELIEALLAEHGLSEVPHQLLFSSRAFKQCGGRYAPPAAQEPAGNG